MEYWFIIILALVAVVAIGLLLYFEVMGDDAVILRKKYRRGKYINDENAVIYRSIKDTKDPKQAYIIFVEYIFSNQKLFLEYVKTTLHNISKSYNEGNLAGLRQCVEDTKEMKIELKDQRISQYECVNTIDRYIYIEFSAWINIANNSRFSINDSLRGMAEVCLEYAQNYSTPFPELYVEQLNVLINDICNICNSCLDLVGTNNTQEMRELRKNMSVILDESYANAQRLFEVIHDGRSQFEIDKHIALKYALNAFQELHGIIYTLRRFVLADICITLSIQQ
ncbi:MAG: hypothetical protein K2L17_12420 [Muribaculaceae bacterium]|nr:hypothetical protein [Muribaculaceae bacterium]